MSGALPSELTTLSTKDLADKILTAQFDIKDKKGRYYELASKIDPAKILPSNPQLNYLDIQAKLGAPVNQLSSSRDGKLNSYQSRILSLGRDTAQSVLELRYEDQEKFKIDALRKSLPFNIETSPYTIKAFGKTFEKIDLAKTLKNGPNDALERFFKAHRDWIAKDKAVKSHLTAIKNARKAVLATTCRLPRL
ncbi:hypothetical protein PG993_000185 [Apiospora rasikravindrae]|uniref:Uncharacterized protein n=1 Tax=Apiospora rasikravindrae TaxID=990691 RepID=A0ABR1U7S5_9PEZI